MTWRTLKLAAPARKLFGVLGIFLVVALMLASAHRPLHHAVHSDADHPEHSCAITLFSQSQVNLGSLVPLFAFFCSAYFVFLISPEVASFTEPTFRLPPSCGPPSF